MVMKKVLLKTADDYTNDYRKFKNDSQLFVNSVINVCKH